MSGRPPLRLIEIRDPRPPAGRAAPLPALGPALELAALGAGLTLTMALLARLPSWFAELGRFQALTAVAFAFFAIAMIRLERYRAIPRAGLIVFGVALAARSALVPVPPSLSDDLYRYVWEGKVAAAGLDPWRLAPRDPALAPLRDRAIHPHVNHPDLSAIYPPLAIAGFALVARVSATVIAFKIWVVLHDLALVVALLVWSGRRHGSAAPAIAYAWNPLVILEYAGNGHHDPLALVWMALAFLWLERRPTASAAALAVASLVRLAPLVAAPFLFARWSWRARAVFLALLVPGLVFYAIETRGAHSGLAAYWGSWRNNELAFHVLERWTGSFARARAIAIGIVALVTLAWLVGRARAERAARATLRTALLVSPVLHPWYLGWALVFEPLAPAWPWALLSLTVFLNYGVLATPAEGHDYHLPLAWRWVEYGLPAAVALAIAWRRRRSHELATPEVRS